MPDFIRVTAAHRPHVALIELNRPQELNALNLQLLTELRDALRDLATDDTVRCVVLTGSARAFAAGADIKQLQGRTAIDMLIVDQFAIWQQIKLFHKPLIAAVSGFALGGGCELAMICDMIVASETAQFGQPEIKLGTMPGAGGTQRLTRALGKARAMELVLTGSFLSADEALRHGLINRVVPVEVYLEEALKLAALVARQAPVAVRLAKEAVLRAHETHLDEGLYFERKNYYLSFASDDRAEGMAAFVEKRLPHFQGR